MTAPAVSAATTATRPTAGASGMNGVQLPVTALVTVSSVTAPAAAPATSPVPATNTTCQVNTAATWPRVAPTRPSSRSMYRRSTVVTTRVFTSATADSTASTLRIRSLANEFCAAARADWALATERLVTRSPGMIGGEPGQFGGSAPANQDLGGPGRRARVARRDGRRDQQVAGGQRTAVDRADRGVVRRAVRQVHGDPGPGVHAKRARARFQCTHRDLPGARRH